ncbi:MAG: hypothetical protein ACXQTL_02265 [Methanosarcinales archaeon]
MAGSECAICGKPAEIRVPFTLCEDCRRIVHKWEELKAEQKKFVRKSFGIEVMEMSDDDLQLIANRVADIEESVRWIKNVLFNLRKVEL